MTPLFGANREKRRQEVKSILGTDKPHDNKGNAAGSRAYLRRHIFAILALCLLLLSLTAATYYFNRLAVLREQVRNLRADIRSAVQMRQNTIPGLVMAVNLFTVHESKLMLRTLQAREDSLKPPGEKDRLREALKEATGSDFSPESVSKFMAVAENYPQLLSSQSYQLLITNVAEVESQISQQRIQYNDAAQQYNRLLSTVPAVILGRLMGFGPEPYFEWDGKSEWDFVENPMQGEPLLKMKPVDAIPEQ